MRAESPNEIEETIGDQMALEEIGGKEKGYKLPSLSGGLRSIKQKVKKFTGFDGMPFHYDDPVYLGGDVLYRTKLTNELNRKRKYKEKFKNLEGEAVDRVLLSMLLNANEDAVPVIWFYVKKLYATTTYVMLKNLFPKVDAIKEHRWLYAMGMEYAYEYNDHLKLCIERKRKAVCPAFTEEQETLKEAFANKLLVAKDREGVKQALRSMIMIAHAMTKEEMNLAIDEAKKAQKFFKYHLDQRLASVWYEQKRLLPILRKHEEETAKKIELLGEQAHAWVTDSEFDDKSIGDMRDPDVQRDPNIRELTRKFLLFEEELRADRTKKLEELNENAAPILAQLKELEKEANGGDSGTPDGAKVEALARAKDRITARLDKFKEFYELPKMPEGYNDMYPEVDALITDNFKINAKIELKNKRADEIEEFFKTGPFDDEEEYDKRYEEKFLVKAEIEELEAKRMQNGEALALYREQAKAERVQFAQAILNEVQTEDELTIKNTLAELKKSTPMCADALDGFSIVTEDAANFKQFKADRAQSVKDLIDYAQLGMTAASFGVSVTAAIGGSAAFGAGAAIAPAVMGATTALTGVAAGLGKDFVTRLARGEANILDTTENLLIWLRAVLENPTSPESFGAPASYGEQEACFKSLYTLYDLMIMTLDPETAEVSSEDIDKYAEVSPAIQQMQEKLDATVEKSKNADAASYLMGQGKGILAQKVPLTGGIKAGLKVGSLIGQ